MGSSGSTIFAGSSRYAADFQAVIDRSVAIASLPLSQMRYELETLNAESSALNSLDNKFGQVQAAITNLSLGTGWASFRSSVSDTAIASASLSTGVLAGDYTLEVLDIGAYTNTMSKRPGVHISTASVADAAAGNLFGATEFKLKIDGVEQSTFTAATLQDLAGQIDALAAVDASVAAVGGGWGISLQTTAVSGSALELTYKDAGGVQQAVTLGKAAALVADPAKTTLASPASFRLKIGGAVKYTIVPTGTALTSLAEDINKAAGADVQATVVNVGSSAAPDYRLSIQMKKLGASAVQLEYTDGNGVTQTVLDQLALGAQARYEVNGSGITSTSDSRSVALAPGLNVQLLDETAADKPIVITVSRDTGAIRSALSSFAGAYNAVIDDLNRHRGSSQGALAGDSIVASVFETLQQIATYSTGNTGIASLTVLGLTLDGEGVMAYDSTAFSQVTNEAFDELLTFLGSPETGGFLKAAAGAVEGMSNETNGALTLSLSSMRDEIDVQNERIEEEQSRIDDLAESLRARMAAADALIASLEQQVLYITNMFGAMRTASESMN